MELKMGNSCGSCIHSNRPKAPREHAAHYEVAKTERWCYKHNRHVTRESTCVDHEGVSQAAKTGFSRVSNFNDRIERVKAIVNALGDREIKVSFGAAITFYVEKGWLKYRYNNFFDEKGNSVNTKSSTNDKYFDILEKELNISRHPF